MTIKVGDKVTKTSDKNSNPLHYDVLHIQDKDPNRTWYVIAFMSDIPQVFKAEDLQKVHDWVKFYIEGACFKVVRRDGVIDFSTATRV